MPNIETMNDETSLLNEIDELGAELRAAEDDNLTYLEQRKIDVSEIQRLRSLIDKLHDWQGCAVDQMQRVLWSWDNEIDANILAELDKMTDTISEGRAQMGEI